MSTQPTEGAVTEPQETTESEQQAEQTKPTETVDFWKQKAREQEKRAKENAEAAKRLAEIENAQKTAEQKAAELLAQVEKRAVEAEAKALRRDVALEFKLSKDDAALLDTISDEDAMRALAGRLAQSESDRRKSGNHAPREGNTPSKTGATSSWDSVLESLDRQRQS
jgi:membrane protein involved in colicin uptake